MNLEKIKKVLKDNKKRNIVIAGLAVGVLAVGTVATVSVIHSKEQA